MRPYEYCAGELRIGGHSVLLADNAPADTPELSVAVLIDGERQAPPKALLFAFRGRTSTRSFGPPTAGIPTGNVCHRLTNGSMIAITESVPVDRAPT